MKLTPLDELKKWDQTSGTQKVEGPLMGMTMAVGCTTSRMSSGGRIQNGKKSGARGNRVNKQVSTRRKYLIDPALQYWLMGRIGVMAGMTVAMSLLILAIAYHFYGDVTVRLAQPDPFSSPDATTTAVSYHSVFGLLWPIITACTVGTVLITLVSGLFISHRLAGPAFRIRKTLLQMAGGDLGMERLYLRKKDMLKPMAQAVNELSDALRRPVREMQDLCLELAAENHDSAQQQRMDRLREIISTFKTS
jgi:hypothetical protein